MEHRSSTSHHYLTVFLTSAYHLLSRGLGCLSSNSAKTTMPRGTVNVVEGYCFVGGGTHWSNGYCTGLQFKQSDFEPVARVCELCSWARHFALTLPLSGWVDKWALGKFDTEWYYCNKQFCIPSHSIIVKPCCCRLETLRNSSDDIFNCIVLWNRLTCIPSTGELNLSISRNAAETGLSCAGLDHVAWWTLYHAFIV